MKLLPVLLDSRVFLFTLYGVLSLVGGLHNVAKIKIAGLFDTYSTQLLPTFQDAVSVINDQSSEVQIIAAKVITNSTDSMFKRSKKLCKTLESGVTVVVSAPGSQTHEYAQSICDTLDIPFIGIHRTEVYNREAVAINLFPYEIALSKPYTDIIRFWQWNTSFTILYEHPDGFLKFRNMLNYASLRFTITSRQLIGPDYRNILREVRGSGETRIILDCATSSLPKILRHAQQLKLLTRDYQYLLTTLDIHTINLSSFAYDQAKITSFQLIDFTANNNLRWIQMNESSTPHLSTEQALVYDAVALISKAFGGEDVSDLRPFRANCEKGDSWPQGSEVLNALFHTEFEGLTGTVKFDAHGRRSEFILDIVQVTETGHKTVGLWTANETVRMGAKLKSGADVTKRKILRAVTKIEAPYVMRKSDADMREGNDKYEGYAVELMNKIMSRLELNYTLEDSQDEHGNYDNVTNTWTGMIGELVNGRADVAVGGITINYEREQAVDFTKPFMHLGISILFRKPEKKPPDLFSFLHPFSADVWLYMTLAFLAVSLTIFILGRFTPYEWYNPHPCDEGSNVVENQFTIGNSLWFTVGSLMQQGSDIAPRAVSTRVVAGSWWFFTLIMIASYTANLAAFLAVERTDQPIKSADDLVKQNAIRYGCYKGGATYNFFKGSKHPVYRAMFQFMRSDQSNFRGMNDKLIQDIKSGKYAYLMETPSLEYNANQHCELVQVGGLLDSKGYGLATPQNSPYRDMISKEILRLQENSELELLKDKWWKSKSQAQCDSKGSENQELGMANVGGVFVVLLGGIGLALICAALEFTWQVRKTSRNNAIPFGRQWVQSFKTALFLRSTKSERNR